MTAWKAYPTEIVHLPEGGKVTGQFVVTWQGNGRAYVHTDAHVNDDKPAVNFRGESFLVSVHLTTNGESAASNEAYSSVTRRSNWTPAPRTFREAVTDAVLKAVTEAWTPEKDRAGVEADVAQNLHHLEPEREKLLEQLAEVDRKIAEQKERLS